MADTLKDAVETRGSYAVWDLLDDDEKRAAAAALWQEGGAETRAALVKELAQQMKFRPQAVRVLPADKVAPRLVRLASTMPELVVFQYLFHLHLAERRELMAEYLDALGLPHEEGILDLPDDAEAPEAEAVTAEAKKLLEGHEHPAAVYLATLKVADGTFWAGVDPVLEGLSASGEPLKS